MNSSNKPPVVNDRQQAPWEQPPAEQRLTRTIAYPQVFRCARWRLALGIAGSLVLLAFISLPAVSDMFNQPAWLILMGALIATSIFALLQFRTRWTLYEDRLEHRNCLGVQRTVRRSDVVAFTSDFIGTRWILRDAHTTIAVDWGAERFSYLCELLRTWAPRPW